MTESREVSIRVPVLARVEGEGALDLSISDGELTNVQLRIYEPPRLFEKFLQGRRFDEVPDMVARICGICPVAYQMSAVHAMESVFACQPGPWVREMRRLIYCGEWIESHALHIHLLAAPDFFGYRSVTEMAKDYPMEVRRGLKLQGLGNELIRILGARSVHPVGAAVGGFYHAPSKSAVAELLQKIKQALPEAEALVRWVATLDVPQHEQQFHCVALRHEHEYPINEGRLVSSSGLDIDVSEFQHHFKEQQVPHSTAFHCHLNGEPYLVGPLARVNLNRDKFPEVVKNLIDELPVKWPSFNTFHSALARAIEVLYALHEAARILSAYQMPDQTRQSVAPQAGVGYACTEAPRGILWHRYEMDQQGEVVNAIIVPPTSQNQARIEADLRQSLQDFGLHNDDDALRQHAEMVVRNYDPCISCSTHFLKLNVDRR